MAVMTVVTKVTNLAFSYAPSDARRSTCTPINRKGEKERDKVFENRFVGGRYEAVLRYAGGRNSVDETRQRRIYNYPHRVSPAFRTAL